MGSAQLRCASVLYAVALASGCGGSSAEGASADDDLKSQGELAVGVAELSGLAIRQGSGGPELLGVGDASYVVVVGSLDLDDVEATTFVAVNLEQAVGTRNPNGSQWESVAADASGRVYVLEESPGRILVFDPSLQRLEHSIELRVERTKKDDALDSLAKQWAKEENSRGEGFVLLTNGHVLVLKEKKESALIEFGPAGETPEGFSAELAVGSLRRYPSPASDVFVPLHRWAFRKEGKLPDLSDLALDATGRLFVVSDEGATLARLPKAFDSSTLEIDLDDVVRLPRKTKSAEALVFLEDGRALVGCDIDKKKNTFVLAPLR